MKKALMAFVFTFILFFANYAHAASVTLAWNANSETDLAGYRIFHREEGQNYDYETPSWEGTETTCTIENLEQGKTYYFVARAFDTNTECRDENGVLQPGPCESLDSNEVNHTFEIAVTIPDDVMNMRVVIP